MSAAELYYQEHSQLRNLRTVVYFSITMKMGGWSSIETVQQFYLKSSDANEKKAVGVLEELMEEGALTHDKHKGYLDSSW